MKVPARQRITRRLTVATTQPRDIGGKPAFRTSKRLSRLSLSRNWNSVGLCTHGDAARDFLRLPVLDESLQLLMIYLATCFLFESVSRRSLPHHDRRIVVVKKRFVDSVLALMTRTHRWLFKIGHKAPGEKTTPSI